MAMAADYESNRAYFDALALTRADGVTRRVRNASADFHAVFGNVITRAGGLLIVEVTGVSREVRGRGRRAALESAAAGITDFPRSQLAAGHDYERGGLGGGGPGPPGGPACAK